eukprot:PRCOL_00003727-RA
MGNGRRHTGEVPRQKGVRDGKWTKTDAELVAAALSPPLVVGKGSKGKGKGKNKDKDKDMFLLGMDKDGIKATLKRAAPDLPAFRAKQLYDAVYAQRAADLDDVTTFSKDLRKQLSESGLRIGRNPVHTKVESADGTKKFLMRLEDNRLVETVGIPSLRGEKERLTACVSSQVGCPLRCTFCATGKGGFARNLGVHEIVDQLLTVEEQFGRRVSNVVFMGMGEPLLNLRNVLPAVRALNEDVGIGARHITISTVGVPNTLRMLAEANLQCTLAVSLHAPNQALRERIVPSARAYPIEALLQDCAQYFAVTRRRVSFEYALLGGVNDQVEHAEELVQILRKTGHGGSHVNLIPWNAVEGAEFERPAPGAVKAFQRRLERAGLGCTIRASRGLDAAAACGQLRNAHQKEPLAAGQ